MSEITTEQGLIDLEVGTVVEDAEGFAWVRGDIERKWNGYDAPYPVLFNIDDRDEWLDLEENPYLPTTVAHDHGPFTVVGSE